MVKIVKGSEIIVDEVEMADKFFKRFMGLMYRKNMNSNHGLLLKPCNEIHTFGMRFPIDVVYLSKDYEIVKLDSSIKPHKVCKTVKNSYCVLELTNNKILQTGLKIGDKLSIIKF